MLKRSDSRVSNVISMVSACVVLHNVCEMFNDNCLPEWNVMDESSIPTSSALSSSSTSSASAIRDAIATHLVNN